MTSIQDSELTPPRPGKPVALLAGACLVLLAAFAIPIPTKILDILWIASFCLSIGVSIICIAAQSSSDLIGFVPMLAGLTFLRLTAQAGSARHIMRDEPAGALIGLTGSALASAWPLAAVLICLGLAVMIIFVIFTSCQKITLAAKGYLGQVFLLKRMAIETDLRLGIIDDRQAGQLAQRITTESRFFQSINGAGLFMRTEAVLSICILLMCLTVPAANNTINPTFGVGLLSAVAPPVVALTIFTLVPAMLVAVTCGMLMSKDTLSLRPNRTDHSTPLQAKKITVIALDAETADDTGLLNPDFVYQRAAEQIVEFEPPTQPAAGDAPPALTDMACRNAKEYYEKLSRIICTMKARPRVIQLASDKITVLPVTVPVNIAIRLAQKKQKVLLVDTDARRNAVGSVFDLDLESMCKKVQPSSLENVSVCCVPAEKFGRFLRNEKVLNHFDTTLIYTPNIPAVNVDNQPPAAKPGVFYFTDDPDPAAGRAAARKLAFCSWLYLIPSIQSVLETKP